MVNVGVGSEAAIPRGPAMEATEKPGLPHVILKGLGGVKVWPFRAALLK